MRSWRTMCVRGSASEDGGVDAPAALLVACGFELGRPGDRGISSGSYDCADGDALFVVIGPDAKRMTPVAGGPSRPCRIQVSSTLLADETSQRGQAPPIAGRFVYQRIVATFEATVGPREDASAETKTVRGSFAFRRVFRD